MIHNMEQGSPEWYAIRLGRATGSKIADITKKLKNGAYSAAREDYAFDLAIERLTGEPQGPDLSNVSWVQDGKEREPDAVALYELMTGRETSIIGFATHDKIEMFGASPDRLVGDDGLLEAKCPKAKTHFKYIKAGVVPEDYIPQMDAEMLCTGRKWVDFVSYHPSFPPHLQLFVVRHHFDNARCSEVEREVSKFLAEVDALHKEMMEA